MISRSQQVVRGLLVLAAVGVLVLTWALAPSPILVLAVALAALTAYAAARPQSWVVTVLVVGLVLNWLASVPVADSLGGWLGLLLAAWLLLVVHLSASLAASLPSAAPIPAVSLRTWARRGAAVSGLMVPVWAVATLSGLQAVPGEVGLTYAAIAAVALLGLGSWIVMKRSG
jgi:hypothetical protein